MRNTRITTSRFRSMAISAFISSLFLFPPKAFCTMQEPESGAVTALRADPEYKEIAVNTSDMDNGITAVTGRVYVNASPESVWSAITDYDHQKHFVPKLIDSGLISDNGSEQIMFEKGKTGILLFSKTVYIKLSIHGDYLRRLSFRQVEGDFKVYEGEWIIDRASDGKGTMLSFNAKIKPDFFAPAMFVRKVQKHDLPMVLAAMKKRAESTFCTVGLAGVGSIKHDSLNSQQNSVAD
jgi:ribosome-associated toxin RatA of RatAB toxin-antitoxin module